jgi:hypothetical protein
MSKLLLLLLLVFRVYELSKDTTSVAKQISRSVELDDAALVDNDDAIGVQDGVQSVRNRQYRDILEGLLANGTLNKRIRFEVHRTRRFIQQQDLALAN